MSDEFISTFNSYYAEEHCSPNAKPVPAFVHIFDECQGDNLGTYVGIIVQFYTGTNQHFVCVLSFEDWDGERCPRFTWYQQSEHDHNRYLQCTNPSTNYTTDDVR